MSDHPAPDWDPRDASILSDQRRAYDDMRERCPVAYSDFLDWSRTCSGNYAASQPYCPPR